MIVDTPAPADPHVSVSARRRRIALPIAILPGVVAVALFVLWAVHNGGYDPTTWYWGALVLLAALAMSLVGLGSRRVALSRAALVALTAFVGYLGWSYLSISWADVPGWALQGSNRTLLYLVVFTLFLLIPWTPRAALVMLVLFVLGVGTIAVVLLLRLAFHDHVQRLFIGPRLVAPTGYYNSTVALFTIVALVAIVVATHRALPALLRGTLLALASASLQVCVIGQSRGWLFTLPLAVVVAVVIVPDRLRFAATAVLPTVGALAPVHTLLHVFQAAMGPGLNGAAASAGRTSLMASAGVFVAGTIAAGIETRARPPSLSSRARHWVGATVAVTACGLAFAGAVAVSHGDPIGFVKREWHGFSHPAGPDQSGTHFLTVGTARYDFWRVSLDGFMAHPIGGLGQDNFADYYVPRRRSDTQPQWTHSLELRLLVHTGIVGFALFATFLVASLTAVVPALRRGQPLTRTVVAAALLPLTVWVIHGSIDWFWELPAVAGPALGFLGMAGSFGVREQGRHHDGNRHRPIRMALSRAAGAAGFVAAVCVLAFPYLSSQEISAAAAVRAINPSVALQRLSTAAKLNPLSPDPGRLAGTIALETDQFTIAEERFQQAIKREPGGWFSWFGAGLAASALGDRTRAHHDFVHAEAINSRLPVIKEALADVYTAHPLAAAQAFQLLAQP